MNLRIFIQKPETEKALLNQASKTERVSELLLQQKERLRKETNLAKQ
jgi:hypothetical protein